MQYRITPLLGLGLSIVLCFCACKKDDPEPTCVATDPGTVTDIDGNIYETVKIGTQVWMTENLRTTKYSNGDAIPNITADTTWEDATSSGWCWFDNDSENENVYGKLYNWFVVSDVRNVCPTGWHVPTDEDWKTLELYLGMDSVDVDSSGFLFRGIAQNIGGMMRAVGTDYWIAPNDSATNVSCFSGLPGGGRNTKDGTFTNLGYYAGWWTATEKTTGQGGAWYRSLSSENGSFSKSSYKFQNGVYIRCIKD
ncbi:MAG: fibrobacter succinogenes major paralogous domain-containing protein [Flavobacteriales bacterium]|nr:fibrobacter succinogenes major paralogous domain-containing protein [Flavobacteriales bacterium]